MCYDGLKLTGLHAVGEGWCACRIRFDGSNLPKEARQLAGRPCLKPTLRQQQLNFAGGKAHKRVPCACRQNSTAVHNAQLSETPRPHVRTVFLSTTLNFTYLRSYSTPVPLRGVLSNSMRKTEAQADTLVEKALQTTGPNKFSLCLLL